METELLTLNDLASHAIFPPWDTIFVELPCRNKTPVDLAEFLGKPTDFVELLING